MIFVDYFSSRLYSQVSMATTPLVLNGAKRRDGHLLQDVTQQVGGSKPKRKL